MKQFTRLALPCALVLLLAACDKPQEAAPAPVVTPAPVAEPVAPAPVAVPEVAPAETVAPVAVATGVAECDDYLTKYAACLADKVPEAARATMQQSMDATRQAWMDAAKTPETAAGMAVACKQATEAARTSMTAYGCNDF